MYYLITTINIVAAIVTITLLVKLPFEYVLHKKWQTYIWWKVIALMYLLAIQVYTLAEPSGEWKLKLGWVFVWGPTFLFIRAIRASSLRKAGDESDVIYTTENK